MSKKIAIQSGLENIKEKLIDLGYEVFDINERKSVEAIVYMADGYSIPYENQLINMAEGEEMVGGRGAILINATGKTIDDIDYIINNRVYSPLFK